jgi:hypothetical protein
MASDILPPYDRASCNEPAQLFKDIPVFPVIKLRHNNLNRLKQHVITVGLLDKNGSTVAQGSISFQDFIRPAEFNPVLMPLSASKQRSASIPPICLTDENTLNQTVRDVDSTSTQSFHMPILPVQSVRRAPKLAFRPQGSGPSCPRGVMTGFT